MRSERGRPAPPPPAAAAAARRPRRAGPAPRALRRRLRLSVPLRQPRLHARGRPAAPGGKTKSHPRAREPLAAGAPRGSAGRGPGRGAPTFRGRGGGGGPLREAGPRCAGEARLHLPAARPPRCGRGSPRRPSLPAPPRRAGGGDGGAARRGAGGRSAARARRRRRRSERAHVTRRSVLLHRRAHTRTHTHTHAHARRCPRLLRPRSPPPATVRTRPPAAARAKRAPRRQRRHRHRRQRPRKRRREFACTGCCVPARRAVRPEDGRLRAVGRRVLLLLLLQLHRLLGDLLQPGEPGARLAAGGRGQPRFVPRVPGGPAGRGEPRCPARLGRAGELLAELLGEGTPSLSPSPREVPSRGSFRAGRRSWALPPRPRAPNFDGCAVRGARRAGPSRGAGAAAGLRGRAGRRARGAASRAGRLRSGGN